jgi:hypothetical protein
MHNVNARGERAAQFKIKFLKSGHWAARCAGHARVVCGVGVGSEVG